MDSKARSALDACREEIDAIDDQILELLARRTGVVAKVATLKRGAATPVRDPAREEALLAARRRRADELGLPPALVGRLFGMIMAGSREQQSAAGAEAAVGERPRTVAVIGGRGGLGTVVSKLLDQAGHEVLVADLDTELTPVAAAERSDVVVVSVPIRATEQVIREVGPAVRPDGILMDVTSVKGFAVEAMLASTRASVVGAHPMFGPTVQSLRGQRVVLCPGRGDEALRWARRLFEGRGMSVTVVSAEEHDRAMSVVQVLTHHQTEALGLALARLGIDLEVLLSFTSPVYLLEAYVTARHFAQSPELYGPLQMLNSKTGEVTAAFRSAAEELAEILATGDQARFDGVFEEVGRYFGDFTDEALEQSKSLVDDLAERPSRRSGQR